jgi:hypothetical protein
MEEILLLQSLIDDLENAQQELLDYNKSLLDSGDANWVKDQERYIKSLEERIEELTEGFS